MSDVILLQQVLRFQQELLHKQELLYPAEASASDSAGASDPAEAAKSRFGRSLLGMQPIVCFSQSFLSPYSSVSA